MSVQLKIKGQHIYLVGAKGTGMCALAEVLLDRGARVSGSDTEEVFYTDKILSEIGVKVTPFDKASLPDDISLLVHSSAYGFNHPLIAQAREQGLPTLTYPEALGTLSSYCKAVAVSGVHGKTTTTALAGNIVKSLGLPATVIVGSAVANFKDRSTWLGGQQYLIAETCEYRRNFLCFHPDIIVVTSIESDHQDVFPDFQAISQAFEDFMMTLPSSGTVIYCADDQGASSTVQSVADKRPDIHLVPYGISALGDWRVQRLESGPGKNGFRVAKFPYDFYLSIPGHHTVLDAVAALALIHAIDGDYDVQKAAQALAEFKGCRRRSEIIGQKNGILIMDDYAHHPTAIRTTLSGLRQFYPNRRLVVDFMSHTYSRTAALLDDFAKSFESADLLNLHPIYASAREQFTGHISGKMLYEQISRERGQKETVFHENFEDAIDYLKKTLHEGDLFITLGAGNNWTIGRQLYQDLPL